MEKQYFKELTNKLKTEAAKPDIEIIQLILNDDDGLVVDIIESASELGGDCGLLTKAGTPRAALRDFVQRNWKYRNNIEINAYPSEDSWR